ncbi:hypothetical protein QWJ34_03510 [Saccharibacillus sp. CPCC 101409]|uniref:hypothetical protein n=1 Tax=Saccharibacillus sp. CPCC 101409 TaxID=3058041 RepID=UPI00267249F1|nr:hypothetical protein [Saccharibacillus sp. CPCC 101409]MDO3408825.1 hypothetical protein [Saccharibacillus sp. CPCC 101409]
MDTKKTQEQSGFLFNVDVLIDGSSNAQALQSLLEMLNGSKNVIDLRINSGIEVGRIIESALAGLKTNYVEKSKAGLSAANGIRARAVAASEAAPKEIPKSQPQPSPSLTSEDIRDCIRKNRLVRLIVNKPGGNRLSIPCRILNFDESAQILSVYHVDEKQVYSFSLNEIDELSGA